MGIDHGLSRRQKFCFFWIASQELTGIDECQPMTYIPTVLDPLDSNLPGTDLTGQIWTSEAVRLGLDQFAKFDTRSKAILSRYVNVSMHCLQHLD